MQKNTSLFEEKHKQKQNKKPNHYFEDQKQQNKTTQNKSRIHLHVVAFVFFFSRSFSFAGDLVTRIFEHVKHLRKKHNNREKRANKKRQEGNTCKKRANKQQPHINVLYTGFSFGFVFMLLLFFLCVFCLAFSCAVLIVFCSKSGLDWVFCFSLILFSFLFVL